MNTLARCRRFVLPSRLSVGDQEESQMGVLHRPGWLRGWSTQRGLGLVGDLDDEQTVESLPPTVNSPVRDLVIWPAFSPCSTWRTV